MSARGLSADCLSFEDNRANRKFSVTLKTDLPQNVELDQRKETTRRGGVDATNLGSSRLTALNCLLLLLLSDLAIVIRDKA